MNPYFIRKEKKNCSFDTFFTVDPEITMTFDGKSIKRNNKEHLGMENAKLTFKVSK